MKRFFISFLLMFCFSVFSFTQSIQLLTTQNTVLSNGDTLTVSGSVNDIELISAIRVKNISSANVEVTCRKWVISSVSGSSNVFCWAGFCYSPTVTESNPRVIAPNAIVDDFSGHYYPHQNPGQTVIMYTFDVRNGDSAWFFVNYNVTEQSIHNVVMAKLGKPYPNPADKEVFVPYTILHQFNGMIEIYDITGRKQVSQVIKNNANVVCLSTSNLKEGIYFIQLMAGNKLVGTEKLIIKR